MIPLRPKFSFCLLAGFVLLVGCGDDGDERVPPPAAPETPTPRRAKPADPEKLKLKAPVVYLEELDQFQEYFKEQHDTSFSQVRKKNWMSFTAGKTGVLTRIALYGKPHFATSDFYGPEMSGIIRADNPDQGPKLAEWSLSRADIVSQLAEQGLGELDYGWIDVKMLGEAVMEVGETYYMVCERITGGKHWFGAFSFSEGDSYKGGRHWLHPKHDLVFRSYVGQVEGPSPPPSPEANASTTTPDTNASKSPPPRGAPIPQAPKTTRPPTPPSVPPKPPQPRLRSLPLPQTEPAPGAIPLGPRIQPGTAIPTPPPIPKPPDANAAGDKNGSAPRGLLPGLFRRP